MTKGYVRVKRKSVFDPERECGCKCAGGCNAVPRKHCGRWWCEFDKKSEPVQGADSSKNRP